MSLWIASSGVVHSNDAPEIEPEAVMGKAATENFPVASRLVPARYRTQLLAVYGFARFVDDIGDLVPGDRPRQLDWAEQELDRAFAGSATHPVFVRLSECVRSIATDRTPFADLIAANRQDQVVSRYESFEDLERYCALSANPIGRIVLAIFGRHDALAVTRSDEICTALQLVEHWQDVKEDLHAGRIYIPQEDMRRFSVRQEDLALPSATSAFRRLMAFEVGRARELLRAGSPLVAMLSGAGRIAIAGFIGGGLAQLDAIDHAGYDVLASSVKAPKTAVTRRAIGTYFTHRTVLG